MTDIAHTFGVGIVSKVRGIIRSSLSWVGRIGSVFIGAMWCTHSDGAHIRILIQNSCAIERIPTGAMCKLADLDDDGVLGFELVFRGQCAHHQNETGSRVKHSRAHMMGIDGGSTRIGHQGHKRQPLRYTATGHLAASITCSMRTLPTIPAELARSSREFELRQRCSRGELLKHHRVCVPEDGARTCVFMMCDTGNK